MSSRGVKQSAQLPAAPVDVTPPARVGKRGALSVPRLGQGSNAVPAPVRSIKFEAQGGAKAPIEFVEGGPMRPLRRSRDARMTTNVSSSDDSDSSSDRFKGQAWRVEYEYYTDHRMYFDKHEIVDAIYKYAESYMHDSGTRQDPDFVGKPDDLYLWRYSGGSKTTSTYSCPFSITCDCDAGIRVSELKTKIVLEATGRHDKESHRLRVMHAGCSARGVGGFKSDLSDNSSDSMDSADDSCGLACYDSRMFTVHSRFSAQAINAVLRACCAPVGKRRLWLSILCGLLFSIAQF
jgi:hypothetical protein